MDFLVNWSQVVRYHDVLSQVKTTSTGAIQGTGLSPVLFTIYTDDIKSSSSLCSLSKYSDDSALADFSNSGTETDWIKLAVSRQ